MYSLFYLLIVLLLVSCSTAHDTDEVLYKDGIAYSIKDYPSLDSHSSVHNVDFTQLEEFSGVLYYRGAEGNRVDIGQYKEGLPVKTHLWVKNGYVVGTRTWHDNGAMKCRREWFVSPCGRSPQSTDEWKASDDDFAVPEIYEDGFGDGLENEFCFNDDGTIRSEVRIASYNKGLKRDLYNYENNKIVKPPYDGDWVGPRCWNSYLFNAKYEEQSRSCSYSGNRRHLFDDDPFVTDVMRDSLQQVFLHDLECR